MSITPPESVTKANIIKTSITVNGKRFDFKENLNKGTTHFIPHNQTLTEEDLKAINGAYYDFEGTQVPLLEQWRQEFQGKPYNKSLLKENPRLPPSNPLTPQNDLLLRMLMFLSEAPVGVPLKQITATQPTPEEIEFEPPREEMATGSPSEGISTGPVFVGSDDSGLTEAACEDKSKFISLELVGCRNPNDNELYIHNCWTGIRTTQHDDGQHCFKTFRKYSGPRISGCAGRCGPRCGRKNGLGIYTVDCLDHDHAVAHVGYTAPRAQDEFRWTFGDTTYGQNHPRQKCRR